MSTIAPSADAVRYDLLAEQLPIGVICQAPGAPPYANPAALRLLGLSLAQLRGHAAIDGRWRLRLADGVPLALADLLGLAGVAALAVDDPRAETPRWLRAEPAPGAGPQHLTLLTPTAAPHAPPLSALALLARAQAHALSRFGSQPASHADLGALIQRLVDLVAEAQRADIALLTLQGPTCAWGPQRYQSGSGAAAGAAALLSDLAGQALRAGKPLASPTLAAALAAPLRVGDTVVGALATLGPGERPAGAEPLAQLEVLADQLAVAVEGCHAYAELLQENAAREQAELQLRQARAELEQKVRERTAALEVRAAQYQALANTTLDGQMRADASGRILEVNDTYCQMLGYTRDELLQLRITDVGENPAASLGRMARIVSLGAMRFETRHRRKDGSLIDLEINTTYISDAIGLVSFLRDISDRKRAEAEIRALNADLERRVAERTAQLHASEARLGRILEAAPVPMLLLREESGEVVLANERLGDMLGVAPGELLGRPLPEAFLGADGLARLQHDLQPCGQAHSRELPIRRADGTTIWALGACAHLAIEREELLLVSLKDITARRAAEEQARKLSLAVDQSPASVVITDRAGTIEYVNPMFTQVTGYTPEEAIGQNPRVLQSGVHPRAFYEQLWATLLAGERWQGEFCNRRKDGTLYWELASISGIHDESGAITHFVAVKENVTERKQLEEQLQRAKEAAEAASQAKSLFLANMSHEIRTPMNAVLGFSQLLQREPGLSERQQQYLQSIMRGGEHLLTLINDILEISKIEAGRATLSLAGVDLRALLRDADSMVRMRGEAKGLTVALDVDDRLPQYVIADEIKLRQILINLLGNAVKFTEAGRVALRAWGERQPDERWRLVAEVEDTGPGMSEEERAALFNAFQQTAAGMRAGGTGLGLAISREFARLMSGDITVTSEPGRGSCFRVEVLVEESARAILPAASARRVARLAPRTAPFHVLVVDDIADNREVLSELLRSVGFAVEVVSSGEEAIACFERRRPDLILMDIRMPGMGGLAAIRRIRALEPGRRTLIFAVTASILGSDLEREIALDGYVGKPFRADDLYASIAAHSDVRYEYADQPPPAADQPPPAELGVLPPELVQAMRAATEEADLDRLLDLIAQAGPLAESLRPLASAMQYDRLLELLS